MSARRALHARALRPAAVAASTWAAAAAVTVAPDLALPGLGLAVAAAGAVYAFWRWRLAVLGVAAVALACAAATAGTVASLAPLREELASLQVEGGRQLRVDATVLGHVSDSSDGGAWFDATASEVSAGAVSLRGSVPTRVGVAAAQRGDLAAVGQGSRVRLTGRAIPAHAGERAVLVLRVERVESAPAPTGVWGWFEGLRDGLVASTRGLPQPGAGLVPGLAVGDTSSLAPETDAAMKTASLSHLTAVSGANVIRPDVTEQLIYWSGGIDAPEPRMRLI